MLVLEEFSPPHREIHIIGSTHLGSSDGTRWLAAKPAPLEVRLLEYAVVLKEDPHIAPHHCAIIPAPHCHYNKYMVLDLEGNTHINFVPLEAYESRVLHKGNVINLGKDYVLIVKEYKETANQRALLIGHSGGNLQGAHYDVHALASRLNERGWFVQTLIDQPKKVVWEHLVGLESCLGPTSSLLFYYTGHCFPKGLAFDRRSAGYEILAPDEIHGALRKLPGKKALVLDCCHAGAFMLSKMPLDMLVVAASVLGERAYETKSDSLGRPAGLLSKALIKYLQAHPERVDLSTLEHYLRTTMPRDRFGIHKQFPAIAGPEFVIHSVQQRHLIPCVRL